MSITYRPINLSDAIEIAEIAKIDSAIPLEWDPTFPYENYIASRISQISKIANNPDFHFFYCALVGKRIVGFHWLHGEEEENGKTFAYSTTLWTDQEFRGQGIAGKLKSLGEQWARARGYKSLHTNVHYTNTRMLQINMANGFKPDFVKMTKPL